jgi:transcriptional regulator with XRE-family HTH domain
MRSIIYAGGDIVFPKRLKALRKEKKLTAKSFGEKFNLAESTISGYETGARKPDIEQLEKFADFFDVSIDYLMGRTNLPSTILTNIQRSFIEKIDLSDDELVNIPMYSDGRELSEEEKRRVIRTARALLDSDR